MTLKRAAPISILPLVVENRQPTGSVSLISTTFEDGHHSDISPLVANRQTESILIQSSSFRNITSDCSVPPSTPLSPAGKTQFFNTKTDHVEGVFYGTLTNKINLDGEFFFSNDTFLNTTHSNEDYTCPGGTCTSRYVSDSSYLTIKNSLFSGCSSTTDDGGAIWVGSAVSGTLFVVDCQFQSCSSAFSGGAIHCIVREMIIRRNTFTNCHAGSFGGVFNALPTYHTVEFSENTCTSCTTNIADTNYHVNEATGLQLMHNNTFSVSGGAERSDCLLCVYGTAQVSNNIFKNSPRSVDAQFSNLVLHTYSITSVLVFGNKCEWTPAFSHPWTRSNSPDIAVWLLWSGSAAFPLIDSTGLFLPASKKGSVTPTKEDTSNMIIIGHFKDENGYAQVYTAPASPSNPFFVLSAKRTVMLRQLGMNLKVAPIAFASISNGGTVLLSEVDFFVSTSTLTKNFITVTSSTLTIDTVKLSSLNLGSTSVVRMEGASTLIVTNSNFASISQTSAGGAFLSTTGASSQIITITGSTFDKVTSKGDGGVILAELGTGSKLTVSSTTFSSCSSTGKGGALSIVLSSTGSFALQSGTLFSSCTATNGNAVFVQASSLSSAVTRTSMGFLGSSSITPTTTLLNLYRGWNTANTSDSVPLILFFATMGSTGHANSSGKDGMMCGFSVYPCQTLAPVQTTLVSYGSKTGGTLNPITIQLHTALPQSIPFSCGGHSATISGNTITLSNTGQFTTASSSSSLTLSALTILFAIDCGVWLHSWEWIWKHSCLVWNDLGRVVGDAWDEHIETGVAFLSSVPCDIWDSSDWIRNNADTLSDEADILAVRCEWGIDNDHVALSSLAHTQLCEQCVLCHKLSLAGRSLSSVSFSSCNCGVDGKGRSVFVSRSSFSSGNVVMKSVSITKAGTLGSHEVYLEGQNVGAVVTSDWTSLIGANDGTLTLSKLDEVFGSDPTNTKNCGPLGYHLYPHASGAVFVSEGFWDHGKCGQERLPCSTLPFAFSLLTTTKTTLSISSDLTLSSSLSSPKAGASISSSSSFQKSLLFDLNGLFVVKAGPLAFSSMDLTIPTSLTKTLFVVKGSTLTLSNTVSITNPSSAAHSSSLFEVEGGSLTLSSTVFDFAVRFSSSSSLLAQTAGSLKLDTVSIGNVRHTDGDGSVVHSSLSTPEDKLEIVGCSFSACSSTGNGGLRTGKEGRMDLLARLFQSTFGSDISCGQGKKGEWIFLRGSSLESYLTDSTWTRSISTLVAPTHDALLWGEDGSEEEDSEYASLSLLYYLKAYNKPTIAVGDGGRDGEGCGRTHLRCSSLSTAVSHLSGSSPFEVEIVSSFSLMQKETFSISFTMKPSGPTGTITVGKSGVFEVSANILTLSTLTFDGKGSDRSNSLLSFVNTGSITITRCTFKNLKTDGIGAVFSSTLNTANTLSISDSTFSSCSSAGNGGALFVEVNGGSFLIHTALTFTSCSSEGKGQNLFLVHSSLQSFLSGGSLDGIKPTLPSSDLVSKEEKEKWFGSSSKTTESSSLLFFWHPHTESSGAIHVHEKGESHSLCGLHQLPCSLVQPSLSKTNTNNKTIIDSDFILNEVITTANTPSTLTSVSKSVIISVGVDGKFALSSGSLTLSTLSFVQLSSLELLDHTLISIDSASSPLTVDGCSFRSFRLSANALIEHSCSSLTLKSSLFNDIVRSEGNGGVVESGMEEGMELDVDSVELASVWTLSGDGDGFFISFNSISDPTKIPSFKLTRLTYSESAGSKKNTERNACFVWIEGKRLSEWVKVSDARFAGSFSSIGIVPELLWSVDWEEDLNASLLFYLVAHSGPIGVSSEGYSIVQCGYSGVWCLGLEYGRSS
ncbi:hypothetical protein BLNAU_6821 [Blattamonas nauphoetae]|uniref:Uncharacterized protein n=1 Tax=Blattamonas nauphoetae TaxID=2049346 RepID=A0ABQ9Y2Z6_9EUKA|nr:hypothetical protein BLNAU_6821 [Blattamonas nauphoetae]